MAPTVDLAVELAEEHEDELAEMLVALVKRDRQGFTATTVNLLGRR